MDADLRADIDRLLRENGKLEGRLELMSELYHGERERRASAEARVAELTEQLFTARERAARAEGRASRLTLVTHDPEAG